MRKRIIAILLALAMVFSFAACSKEEEAKEEETKYPEGVITILCTTAGSVSDTGVRLLAERLKTELGVDIVIENGESSTTPSMRTCMHAEADGYTLCFGNLASILNDVTGKADFNILDSFDIVSVFANQGQSIIAVRTESGFKTYEELVQYTKDHPGELVACDSFGSQTGALLSMAKAAGLDVTSADVGNANKSVTALMSKSIDVYCSSYAQIAQYIATGEVTPLLVLDDQQIAADPSIPTAKDLGLDINFDGVAYLVAPKGTDETALKVLNAAIEKICGMEEFKNEVYTTNGWTANYIGGNDAVEALTKLRNKAIELGIGDGKH